MIYQAFRKLDIGEIIHVDHTPFEVVDRKETAVIKTLTLYEYTLKELIPYVQNQK